ncbi:ESX secretion-associated protein EspG [Prescottella equi]|uniref:ESX secretion-associated protein EspG n=1 Tax=Rhodococcus hoagii TaxID=43767 RepID=UPI0007CD53C3|nr:ESX secretion-associated protein EspG [Prescottella equi]MBM4483373.1 ESX secretion-associated protein EspG [Prescottella equi]MBM4634944.1 ESX secretion-associated protein EspG [Prescottella equi]MBM4733664.1 ESX secretion-associated protein EspG [Prescottella equi]NKR80384.1 ESX secretion-associated protein EspG [Prescottella equi]NKS40919.1 ESX secretion-associated protein EspG [Prescottella equi]
MIDLGIDPVGTVLPSAALTVDELDLLVHLLDVDVLPVVLDAGSRFDSVPARDAAFDRAHATLTTAGLLDGGSVHPDLARWLRVLARPRGEIAARRFAAGTIARLCLAFDDDGAVLALRSGDSLTLQHVQHDLAGPVAQALGTADALAFGVVNRPTEVLGAALDRLADPDRAAAELARIGVPAADAAMIGPALAGCPVFTEIVGIVHEDGRPDLMHGPVTVFDTAAGRIVGTTSIAADGSRWTSLSPGHPGRLRQALVGLLDELV